MEQDTETEARAAFEMFLDDVSDVMQLYYTGRIDWAEALRRIEAASHMMRLAQAAAVVKLAAKDMKIDRTPKDWWR